MENPNQGTETWITSALLNVVSLHIVTSAQQARTSNALSKARYGTFRYLPMSLRNLLPFFGGPADISFNNSVWLRLASFISRRDDARASGIGPDITGRSLTAFGFLLDVPITRLRNESFGVRSVGGGRVIIESPSESFRLRHSTRGSSSISSSTSAWLNSQIPGFSANLTQPSERGDLIVRGLECESLRRMLRGIDAAEGGRCLQRKGETARGAVWPNIGCSGSVLGHRACSSDVRKDCVRESLGEDGGVFRRVGIRLWR